MMGIKTKYDISLEINEKSFSIVSCDPNQEQREELDAFVEKNQSQYTKRDGLKVELNEAVEEFSINKQILEYGAVIEKASVWLEQKKLNKKIFQLQKEIDDIDKGLNTVEKTLEEIYKKRFELLIVGADKVSLQKEITSQGIRYKTIFFAIAELIKDAKEKK